MDMFKSKIVVFLICIFVIGVALAGAGFSDVKCVITGKTVEIGNAEKKDYREVAIADGEIFFIQGPFAEYEETTTNFGVPTGKKQTYYYLALDMKREDFVNAVENGQKDALYNGFYFVYSATDKKKVAEADKAVAECEKYIKQIQSKNDFSNVPDVHLKIEGKLMKQPKDEEYKKIRDDFFATGDLHSSEVADLMVRDGKPGASNVLVFAAGILMALAPIVILIVLFVKKKKEESSSELW